jgi:predicted nucleotidyltransferase
MFKGVEVVYLFGSRARGLQKDDSDIDVGIFVADEQLKENPLFDLKVGAFLESELHCPADVVIMNRANPILQHEVLAAGHRVFERAPERRAQYELHSFKKYLDYRHFQKVRNRSSIHGQ